MDAGIGMWIELAYVAYLLYQMLYMQFTPFSLPIFYLFYNQFFFC